MPVVTLSADGELLLVERFAASKDGMHLGFEEVAVLMGETSATRYQRDYGTMIESLASFVEPQAEEGMRRDVSHSAGVELVAWEWGRAPEELRRSVSR